MAALVVCCRSVVRVAQIIMCSDGLRGGALSRGNEMDPYPEGDLSHKLVFGEDLNLVGAVLLDDRHDVEDNELVQRGSFNGER